MQSWGWQRSIRESLKLGAGGRGMVRAWGQEDCLAGANGEVAVIIDVHRKVSKESARGRDGAKENTGSSE